MKQVSYHFTILLFAFLVACAGQQTRTPEQQVAYVEVSYQEIMKKLIQMRSEGRLNAEQIATVTVLKARITAALALAWKAVENKDQAGVQTNTAVILAAITTLRALLVES